MHILQNHFVIVDGGRKPYRLKAEEVIRICDVWAGVGGEQLLIIEPPTVAGAIAGAYAFMRILHVDGMEVGACVNATRCFGWLMHEETAMASRLLETAVGHCFANGWNIGRSVSKWQDQHGVGQDIAGA